MHGTSEVPGTWAGAVRTADGVCKGIIAFGPAGSNGFGYDPVFYLPEHGLTMAQLFPRKVKNHIGHHGHTAQAAVAVLTEMLVESGGNCLQTSCPHRGDQGSLLASSCGERIDNLNLPVNLLRH